MKELVVCEEYLARLRQERDEYRKRYYDLLESVPDIKEQGKREYLEDLSERLQAVLRKYL